jgi:putative nucleotidyltransferase with HDIG domain
MTGDTTWSENADNRSLPMNKIKTYIVENFEQITVLAILLSVTITSYLLKEKMVMLNFFYLPVLAAGYYINRKVSMLVALLSILMVGLFAIIKFDAFAAGRGAVYVVSSLGGWAGFLILTSHVVGVLSEQKENKVKEIQRAYVGVLEILVKFLESRDPYTKGHSERVAEHAMNIAMAMDLPRPEVENIRVAALLHDIGKIDISSELIQKSANLSREEMEAVSEHTDRGADMLLSVGSIMKGAIPIVLEHHKYFTEMENRDDPSTLGTRIVAVADAFDAMVTDRPYRAGMQPWQAMEELRRCAGAQFDPAVVEAFEQVLSANFETV